MSMLTDWEQPYFIKNITIYENGLYDTKDIVVHYVTPGSFPGGQYMGVKVSITNELAHNMSEQQLWMWIADQANIHVQGGAPFVEAMYKWYSDNKLKSQLGSKWKMVGQTLDEVKFQYNEGFDFFSSLDKPVTPVPSALSMSDLRYLPGLYEEAKHPAPVENDELPECLRIGESDRLRDIIIHLNDRHRWTREQIADWLETLSIDLSFKDPGDILSAASSVKSPSAGTKVDLAKEMQKADNGLQYIKTMQLEFKVNDDMLKELLKDIKEESHEQD